ncbi:glycosyltransferase family 4 protein [Salimicrobium salexigens]|uniref:Galacturonosyltransferase n=1 Tax=Salimicrobium salexigens TaxID=908941 RepID=A0ABY1KVA7_9BACI|nr:glycosyltransferase family 4 protein [Salimicrobium salexigens]SIS82726.1 galacturonosyltransferase [Salimicrobium salexigens]
MKILILANFGMGLYNFRKELLEELISQNHEVYTSFPRDEYSIKLEEIGCKFIDTPISRRGTNPIKDFKLFMDYKKIIRNIQPDVVLTYTIKPNIYGGIACRLENVPYIANITGLGTAVENGGILRKITLFLYKISLNKADCVFFQNEENKNFLTKRNIIKGNHKVIPGSGVNLNHYTTLSYPKDTTVNFLYISRVMKEKGIDQFLDAATYIKEKYPNTKFHIVGFCENGYEDKLKAMQERGVVEFHGKQKDVRKFHKMSHCTIHPTYYPEGMSNVLLESAACGRPIITTDRSGCREVVDDGKNGFLIKQKNSEDLIKKIEEFLKLEYETKKLLGLNGRVKIEREFDRGIIIGEYLDVLSGVEKRNKDGL